MDLIPTATHLPHFPSIIKLDRSNYSFWRAQAISTIRAHGFADFISPTAAAPPMFLPSPPAADHTPNPAHGLWMRRDQYLLSWMLSSVTESMLGHVVRCVSSCDFWSVLERLFMSQSKARVMQLRLLLQSTKKGSMSVEEFFLKMRGYADQLTAIGQMISDDELVNYLLSGFGPEYEALVVNMMHRSDLPNLQEVQYAFQAYELRLQQQHTSLFDLNPTANVAYRGHGRGFNSGNGSGSGTRGGFNRSMSSSSKGIVCQLCGRSGHVAIKCFKRFDIHFTENSITTSTPQAYLSDATAPPQVPTTVHLSQESVASDPSWYVDSGATAHITNNMQNLAVSDDYCGPENLVVGNGQPHTEDTSEGQSN